MSYKSYQDICHKWWYRFDWSVGATPVSEIPCKAQIDEWPGYGRCRGGARGPIMLSWSTTFAIAVWSEKAKRNVVLFDPISNSKSTVDDVRHFRQSAHPSAVMLHIPVEGQLNGVVSRSSRELYSQGLSSIIKESVAHIDSLYKTGTETKWSRKELRQSFMYTCDALLRFPQYFHCSKYVRKRKLDQIKERHAEVKAIHEQKLEKQKITNLRRQKTQFINEYNADIISRRVGQLDMSLVAVAEYIRGNLAKAHAYATSGQETAVTIKLAEDRRSETPNPTKFRYYTQSIEDSLRHSYFRLIDYLYAVDRISEEYKDFATHSVGYPTYYELHNARQLCPYTRPFDTFHFTDTDCVTSRRVVVPADAVKLLMKRWYSGKSILGAKVGIYTVVASTDSSIKVGCHIFSFEWLYNTCKLMFPDMQPGVQLEVADDTPSVDSDEDDEKFCEFLNTYRKWCIEEDAHFREVLARVHG